jgi:hypothetical protein
VNPLRRALGGAFDNDGVLYSFINGSSNSPEVDIKVGEFWMRCASLCISVAFFRAKSKANVADGPTRDFVDLISKLGMSFVSPKLPAWLGNLLA